MFGVRLVLWCYNSDDYNTGSHNNDDEGIVYRAIIVVQLLREFIQLMNLQQCQGAANPQTKPTSCDQH